MSIILCVTALSGNYARYSVPLRDDSATLFLFLLQQAAIVGKITEVLIVL